MPSLLVLTSQTQSPSSAPHVLLIRYISPQRSDTGLTEFHPALQNLTEHPVS